MDHGWQRPYVGERTEPFFPVLRRCRPSNTTASVGISALVTSVHDRNPAMRGRILATPDHASEGGAAPRITAGWFEEEFAASGDRFPEAAERISQLADATESIRTTWTGSPATTTAAWRARPRR